MLNLANAVSETALVTLRSRVTESRRPEPLITDPVAGELLARMEERAQDQHLRRLLARRLPSSLTAHLALRARQYDRYCRRFLELHDDALVVSLGAGFDTRYFRVADAPFPYVELDLPDVIDAKRELLGAMSPNRSNHYEMIGGSVLDVDWIARLQARQRQHVLFLAEGLLMYLPEPEVVALFRRLAAGFRDSEIVFETVHARYTRGLFRWMVARKMQRRLGTRRAATYEYGLRRAADIEAYAAGLRVMEEWSYVQEPDVRPRIMKLFRGWSLVTRSQWTVRARIGAPRANAPCGSDAGPRSPAP